MLAGCRFDPFSQRRLCEICGRKVVEVHLRSEEFRGAVQEQIWMGRSGIGPNDIWWVAIIPGSDFCDDPLVLFHFRDICADGKELLGRTLCSRL